MPILKRQQAMWFQLYNILEKAELELELSVNCGG
jgi:hypothetical protein